MSDSIEPSEATPVASTPKLDSIVVMGHSGTTGYGSDPSNPEGDVVENSWATGSNPDVDSIYRRLLTAHPALKGNNFNVGLDGSGVDDLAAQTDEMLALDPLPDVVIIQSIDNDIRCDGTDPDNYGPFGKTLDEVLTRIEAEDVNAQVFLVSQPVNVQEYTDFVDGLVQVVREQTGTGPCDVFAPSGKVRPQAVAYLQDVVDTYFNRVVEVCARHRSCYTDRNAMQAMQLADGDLTIDGNHLSVAGHTKMAAIAWDALPPEIRNRR